MNESSIDCGLNYPIVGRAVLECVRVQIDGERDVTDVGHAAVGDWETQHRVVAASAGRVAEQACALKCRATIEQGVTYADASTVVDVKQGSLIDGTL